MKLGRKVAANSENSNLRLASLTRISSVHISLALASVVIHSVGVRTEVMPVVSAVPQVRTAFSNSVMIACLVSEVQSH